MLVSLLFHADALATLNISHPNNERREHRNCRKNFVTVESDKRIRCKFWLQKFERTVVDRRESEKCEIWKGKVYSLSDWLMVLCCFVGRGMHTARFVISLSSWDNMLIVWKIRKSFVRQFVEKWINYCTTDRAFEFWMTISMKLRWNQQQFDGINSIATLTKRKLSFCH